MNKMNIFYPALFLVVGFLLPEEGVAAPCTPGTDCYCDKVKNPNSPLFDSKLLMCEDFEAPTLRTDTGFGNGAPYYGPPYDHSGYAGNNRGHNGYWNQKYANGTNSALFSSGQPSSPTLGSPCGFSLCTGLKIWHPSNLWSANAYNPPAAFLADGEFNDEGTEPSSRSGGGSGAFDGTASMFQRVAVGQTAGIMGFGNFGGYETDIGITMAMAYPTNLRTAGVLDDMWKHNEWHYPSGGGGGDGIFLFGFVGATTDFPFYQFTFSLGTSQATCNTRVAAATKTLGTFSCDSGGNFIWRSSSAQYVQSTDWPLGSWACVRARYQMAAPTSATIEMWVTGPAGKEIKIVEISGMNVSGHAMGEAPGYNQLVWNNYSNANQGGGGGPTTAVSGRYEDNIHIRVGAPLSCAQIGYAGSAISAPTNVKVK